MALAWRLTGRLTRRWPLAISACGYRTEVTDPALHTHHDDGRFYLVDEQEHTDYLHAFFPKEQLRLMETLGERALMVRPASRDLISLLAEADLSNPVTRFVLFGRRGSGISCTLAHVLHWCARQGWLLVHAHSLQEILNYSPGMEPSTMHPHLWDSPSEAVAWLRKFSLINKAWLSAHQPTITREVVWNLKESAVPGSSWQELIQFGIARPKYATDAMAVLLREVRTQATASVGAADGGIRPLVCIDGVNALWRTQSRLRFAQKNVLPANMAMFEALRRMLQPDWCNGAILTSVSQKAAWKDQRESHLPRYLLGDEGFAAMEPFVPVAVPGFSVEEAENFVKYYVEMGWVTNQYCRNPQPHIDGVKQLVTLSDRNPLELSKLCGEW